MASTLIKLTPIALALLLAGCGTVGNYVRSFDDPVVTKPTLKNETKLKEPATGAITVAVYNFRDMTGQRKSSQVIASLSSAVTQGADAYLVKSLQEVGDGKWFKVLERGGLDNLVKERQLIRQMRELYQGKDAQQLPPMLFAGMLIEGGIIGYDSNTMSGGSGARIMGIGATTQYQQDEVTISLRAVSVATGEVLVTVNTSKTVISFMDKAGILRFYDAGTASLELETGSATNESMNRAVQMAIHKAVIALIEEGAKKGHWAYKPDPVAKVEEKRNELVQKNSETPPAAAPAAVPQQPAQPEIVRSNIIDGSGASVITGASAESKNTQTDTQVPQAKKQSGTITDWVNVRSTKDQGSEKLVNLAPGTDVEIVKGSGSHYIVRVDGKEGYVAKKFVKVQQ